MPPKSTDKQLKEKKIAEIVNPRLIQAPPTMTIEKAMAFMRENESAYIVVADKKKVVGILTETDVIQKALETDGDWNRPISDIMTKKPLTLNPSHTVADAIDLMAEFGFYHIPLVDENDDLTGVLSVRTLVRFLSEFYPAEVYNLPPNPGQVMPTAEGG